MKYPIPPSLSKPSGRVGKNNNLINCMSDNNIQNEEININNNQDKINFIQTKPQIITPPSEHLEASKKYGDKGRQIRAKLLLGNNIILLIYLFDLFVLIFYT